MPPFEPQENLFCTAVIPLVPLAVQGVPRPPIHDVVSMENLSQTFRSEPDAGLLLHVRAQAADRPDGENVSVFQWGLPDRLEEQPDVVGVGQRRTPRMKSICQSGHPA